MNYHFLRLLSDVPLSALVAVVQKVVRVDPAEAQNDWKNRQLPRFRLVQFSPCFIGSLSTLVQLRFTTLVRW